MKLKNVVLSLCLIASIIAASIFILPNKLFAQKEFSVRNVDHFGGYAFCAAKKDNYAFFIQGPVLTVLEITESGFERKTFLTLPATFDECLVDNNYLYLFQWFEGLTVIDISDPLNPTIISSLQIQFGDTWGQGRINVSGDYLYVTMEDSVKIIDIEFPEAPTITSTILTRASDIFVKDNFAYISSENEFKIFDLSDPQNPIETGSNDILRSTCVSVQGNFAYVGIEEYPDNGIQIFDISNPEDPTKLGFFATKKVIGNTTWFENPQRVAVEENYAYVGCRAQGSTLYIADISDPANPVQAGSLEFDEGSFPNYESIQLRYPYIYAATGPSSVGLIQINVSDPGTPEIELRYEDPWNSRSMATWGETLYVSSSDRLWVYDYADTSKPTLLGSDTTWAELSKIQVQNNYLYGTTGNDLHILDVNDANNIFEVGTYTSTNGNIIEIVIYENFVYLLTVSENQSLLEIVNISDPNSPVKESGEYIFPGSGRDFCLLPDSMFALVAYNVDETDHGFQILDISDPSDLIVLGTAQTTGNPISIGVADTLAIVGSNTIDNWYLETFNIVDPTTPVKIGSTDGGGLSHQNTANNYSSYINYKLAKLNKSGTKLESLGIGKYSISQQSNLAGAAGIVDIAFIKGLNYRINDRLFIAASITGYSIHFFFLEPGTGTVESVLQAICPSPATTVIASIVNPLYMTIFSIDGWLNPNTKLVSGTLGIFIQRLVLNEYLVEINITPQDSTIEEGDKIVFQAKGKDNLGNDMAANVVWSASGGVIDPATGEYTATETGEFTITATDSANDVSASATVTVKKGKVISITVFPPDATVEKGDTIRYTSKGYDKYGNETSVNVTWSASGGNINSGTGLYAATVQGDFTITASDSTSGISGSATVKVTKAKVVSVTIVPADTSIAFGDTILYKAKGFDKNGNETETTTTWETTGGEINSTSGLFKASEVGDFTVTGTDAETNVSGSATVHVTPTGVTTTNLLPPEEFSLSQNYPNPFNPTTTIEFSVKERCLVLLNIYDVRGRLLAIPVKQEHQPGNYRINFNARNLPSGIYFYQIKMNDFVDIKKMVVLE
ncbi:T9SS type A sorting domain-containing protein [candidate division KSB1 bacterium]|nr:T9SS type A sorting domain-containing protein [candidate division KSB1 bacterium]